MSTLRHYKAPIDVYRRTYEFFISFIFLIYHFIFRVAKGALYEPSVLLQPLHLLLLLLLFIIIILLLLLFIIIILLLLILF